ncbi:MAG: HTH domain-containing protein [Prochloraceae cyanobacterium]|nr:HTH domain-containing protein [Prochloraceae cyanobacterium]
MSRKTQSIQARLRRQYIHEEVWRLRSQGLSGQAIAQKLGVSKTTVFNYLRAPNFRERRQRSDSGQSLLNPYQDYILNRWNSGYHNTQGLYEEIQQRGYTGSYGTVARYTRYLKRFSSVKTEKRFRKDKSDQRRPGCQRPLTPSRATAKILRRPESQKPEDKELIARHNSGHPDLEVAISLAQQFAAIVRQRLPEQLNDWLDKAKTSSVALLQSFATGLEFDA